MKSRKHLYRGMLTLVATSALVFGGAAAAQADPAGDALAILISQDLVGK